MDHAPKQLDIDDCDPIPTEMPVELRDLHQAQLDFWLREILAELARLGRVQMAERLDEALKPYGLEVSHAADL